MVADAFVKDLRRRARALHAAMVMLPPAVQGGLTAEEHSLLCEAYDEASAILKDAAIRVVDVELAGAED